MSLIPEFELGLWNAWIFVLPFLLAFGVVIYGYILTRSLVLGVMTIFIVTMVFVAFLLSYLLPRIRSKSS